MQRLLKNKKEKEAIRESLRHTSVTGVACVGVVMGLGAASYHLALRYLVATFGLVVVVVNAILLWLLTFVLGNRVEYRNVLSLLLGGAVIGLVTMVLETLLGTTRPVVDDQAHGFSDAEARPGEAS